MVGLYQEISAMNNSRTRKDLSIMSNSYHITSMRRERQRIHELSIQALPILMASIGKEIHKHPSSTRRFNDVII